MQCHRLICLALVMMLAVATLAMTHQTSAKTQTPAAPAMPAAPVATATDGPASAQTNAMCPVMTDEKIDPNQWVDYQGKRVYLCCARCKRKFQNDPTAYLANLPTLFTAGMETAVSPAAMDVTETASKATPAKPQAHAHEHTSADAHTDAHTDVQTDSPAAHDHDAAQAESHQPGHGAVGGKKPEHDHASHHHDPEGSILSKFVSWIGNFHPPMTNFPVALTMAALIAEILFMVTRRPLFDHAGRFSVWFAIVGTVAAVILGWCFGGFKLTDSDWIMTSHRWVGTAAGLWMVVLAWTACKAWATPQEGTPAKTPWRKRYRIALVIAALLISINGFLGGALIYGLGHYGW